MADDLLRHASLAASLPERVWRGQRPAAAAARTVLLPPALLFRAGTAVRNALYDRGVLRSTRIDVPVVSIGNIAVGGAGKTPFTRHIVERLLARGSTPAILHGGYGDDEPALHRLWHPELCVLAQRDRIAAARRAVEGGADAIVLDDAFQHRRLARDVDIVLVSAESLEQPVRLLPRGPWREPLSALRRADIVVVTRRTASAGSARAAMQRLRAKTTAPTVLAHLRADTWRDRAGRVVDPPEREAFAVTAIANPAAFFANARNAGARLVDGIAFPDHHAFTAEDAARIAREAAGRPLVVTEKDAVKLEAALPDTQMRVLLQRIEIEEGEAELESVLDTVS